MDVVVERATTFLRDFRAFEDSFQGGPAIAWTQSHSDIPVFAVGLYIVFIFQVPTMMSKPMNLRVINAIWNLGLTIFSILGASACVPHLLSRIAKDGITPTVCDDAINWYGNGRVGLWMGLFIYSKFPELMDTVFLVLQGKKVIFLHWFHHVTVLLYCWHAYHTAIGPGIWYATMNYVVHSIMYFYYFVGLIGLRRYFKPFAPLITSLQLAQMVVGIFVTGLSWYEYHYGAGCRADPANMRLAMAMYFSYFVLFAILFQNLYLKPKSSKAKPINPGCDIADRYEVSDASGFFHGKRMDKGKDDRKKKQ